MKSERRGKIGKRKALTFAVLFATLTFVSVGCASGTPPEEEWKKTFGGTGDDLANSVQQTTDGGYILAGVTESYGAGSADFWLVKTDSSGNEQWNKTFGGTGGDWAWSVQQTTDGGYILAGSTTSGSTKSHGAGSADFWLVKTDSSGNEQWNKTFLGTSVDYARAVQQTADGGYILAGSTHSYGAGSADFWLVKTKSSGNEQWNRTFGGTDYEEAWAVQQTFDGGYILAGSTNSYGVGYYDFWLVKTDSNGNKQWDKTFGGTGMDWAYSTQQTADGGYILAGSWLLKTDLSGNKQWDRTFGRIGRNLARAVQQTADGGYILAGNTNSYGAGSADFWLVKIDSNGDKQWDKTFGGTGMDLANSVQQTAGGGYILAGSTNSYGAGGADFWLVKVKGEPTEHPAPIPGFSILGLLLCLIVSAVLATMRKRNKK